MEEITRTVIYAEKDARSLLALSSDLVKNGHLDEAVLISSSATRIIASLKRILNENRLRERPDLLETESLFLIGN